MGDSMIPMIKLFLKNHLLKDRDLILKEAEQMHDFMRLVMKRRNTGVKLTPDEVRLITSHIKRLSLYVPALAIFLLPFGALLLPILAGLLDRREKSRAK
jgi:hypothetical protein